MREKNHPSFYDLDESWYRYLREDNEGRREQCDDMMEILSIVYGMFFILLIGGIIFALCKGWI